MQFDKYLAAFVGKAQLTQIVRVVLNEQKLERFKLLKKGSLEPTPFGFTQMYRIKGKTTVWQDPNLSDTEYGLLRITRVGPFVVVSFSKKTIYAEKDKREENAKRISEYFAAQEGWLKARLESILYIGFVGGPFEASQSRLHKLGLDALFVGLGSSQKKVAWMLKDLELWVEHGDEKALDPSERNAPEKPKESAEISMKGLAFRDLRNYEKRPTHFIRSDFNVPYASGGGYTHYYSQDAIFLPLGTATEETTKTYDYILVWMPEKNIPLAVFAQGESKWGAKPSSWAKGGKMPYDGSLPEGYAE